MAASGGTKKGKGPSQEQVIMMFNQLRQEQRSLATKIQELEAEAGEHRAVIDTLKEIDPDRRCFRMIGGVLVKRTVKDVLPALQNNREQILKVVETLKEQLTSKGKELNSFKEEHNITVRGEKPKESEDSGSKESGTSGVLVAK